MQDLSESRIKRVGHRAMVGPLFKRLPKGVFSQSGKIDELINDDEISLPDSCLQAAAGCGGQDMGDALLLKGKYIGPEIDLGRAVLVLFPMAGYQHNHFSMDGADGKRRSRPAIWRVDFYLLWIQQDFRIVQAGSADDADFDHGSPSLNYPKNSSFKAGLYFKIISIVGCSIRFKLILMAS